MITKNQSIQLLTIQNNFNNETISHFPGGLCNYETKIVKITNYMNYVMFNVTNK